MIEQPIILALDTSTQSCSVALKLATNSQILQRFAIVEQGHTKLILNMVDSLLLEAGIKLTDICAFAFGQGPGSFTGLRIAAAIVQGLALGVGKPVVPISTLEALALQACELYGVCPAIFTALDARMEEIYWGVYTVCNGKLKSDQPNQLHAPAAINLATDIVGIAVGNGYAAHQKYLQQRYPKLDWDGAILLPRALEIAKLAFVQFTTGQNILTPSQALPVYIRNQVAKKPSIGYNLKK